MDTQTETAPAVEPTEDAATSEPLEIDDALESIFASDEEETDSTPPESDEPDDPQMVEETEPESQEQEEEEEETEDEPEEAPSGVDKRISQLVAQKNKMRDKLDAAEERLAALEAAPQQKSEPQKSPWENSLSSVMDPTTLDKKVESAHQMKDWALRNLDGGEVPGEDGEVQYIDAEQVRTALANAEKLLRDAPKQAQVVQMRQNSLQEATASYPWLKDTSSENYQILANELAIWGEFKVKDLPNLELILANALMGENARTRTKKGKPDPAPQKAPEVPTGKTTPRKKKGTTSTAKAKAHYLETGDDHALDEVLNSFL
jgi:hypothetical protein